MSMTLPFVDTSTGHGARKHKRAAPSIRERLDRNGALCVWVNPTTGRRARVCQVAPELFGIQIIQRGKDGNWEELTAFVKSKLRRIEQVQQYLRNTGYVPMGGK